MSVFFYDTADKLALGNARRCGTLDELLEAVDVVTLHVDGRPGNSGLFGPREFAADAAGQPVPQPVARLRRRPRGAARCILSGHLAGAAVDVFPTEPAARGEEFVSELRGLPNVILTPHVGGSTEEAQQDIGHFVAGKLRDYLADGATTLWVNIPPVALPPADDCRRLLTCTATPPACSPPSTGCSPTTAINIEGQLLGDAGEYGYVVTDVAGPPVPTRAAAPGAARDGAPPAGLTWRRIALAAARELRRGRRRRARAVDPALTSSYETDWTGRFGAAAALRRPAGRHRAGGRVLRACAASRRAVVVQGGNTGTRRRRRAGRRRGGAQPDPARRARAGRRRGRAGHGSAPAYGWRRCRRMPARPVSTSGSTSPPATPPRSAASSPPTPAASGCCATAACARSCSGLEAVLADGTVAQPARRPAQGQHRLRPDLPARRQRGHARRRHPGAAAAGGRRGARGPSRSSAVAGTAAQCALLAGCAGAGPR